MVRLKSLINLMLCMSLVGGKKPEYPEKPHRPREVVDGHSTPKCVLFAIICFRIALDITLLVHCYPCAMPSTQLHVWGIES